MKNTTLLGLIILSFITLIFLREMIIAQENRIKVDLPEEISQATPNDTLIAIKKGDSLFVEFKN